MCVRTIVRACCHTKMRVARFCKNACSTGQCELSLIVVYNVYIYAGLRVRDRQLVTMHVPEHELVATQGCLRPSSLQVFSSLQPPPRLASSYLTLQVYTLCMITYAMKGEW